MSPAAVGRNPDGRDSRQIVVLPSLLKTLVIDHKQHQKCVRPNFPAPDPIYSQSGLPSVEQKVTLSWENGHRNLSFLETNLKRILPNSGIKECNFLIQKHLLHRPLSVGWLVGRMAWLVGRLVCQPYFHIFTLWVYLNPHRVLYILVVFPLLYKQALLEEVSLGYYDSDFRCSCWKGLKISVLDDRPFPNVPPLVTAAEGCLPKADQLGLRIWRDAWPVTDPLTGL